MHIGYAHLLALARSASWAGIEAHQKMAWTEKWENLMAFCDSFTFPLPVHLGPSRGENVHLSPQNGASSN